MSGKLRIHRADDGSIMIFGDTKPRREEIKAIRGENGEYPRFIFYSNVPVWQFASHMEPLIRARLNLTDEYAPLPKPTFTASTGSRGMPSSIGASSGPPPRFPSRAMPPGVFATEDDLTAHGIQHLLMNAPAQSPAQSRPPSTPAVKADYEHVLKLTHLCETFKADLDSLRREISELKTENKNKEDLINSQQLEIERLKREILNLEAASSEIQSKIDTVSGNVDEVNNRIDAIQESMTAVIAKLDCFEIVEVEA